MPCLNFLTSFHPFLLLNWFAFFSFFEGAQGVLNKGNLTLDDAELKVTLQKPMTKPSTDNMRLLVRGISEKTTQDGIQSYMEVVSGVEVTQVQFGEPGCVMVTFAEEYGKLELILLSLEKRQHDISLLLP